MSGDIIASLDEAVRTLRAIAAQDSGVIGSTECSDCMAVLARTTLRNIERRLPDYCAAVPDDAWAMEAAAGSIN